MAKTLMKGNEAVAEAAILAGCRHFFGYPITPQNQIPEYMSKRMPKLGGTFLQAESEISAINMVYGAAGAGARVMTSSSSPGISLKQEGISYAVGAEVPCVIVNMVRGGPGLGGIQTAQSDYYQATRGGGHGDYRLVSLAPASVQEAADLTQDAFDIADRYRSPVMLLGDGMIGQMMEPVELHERAFDASARPWAADGRKKAQRAIINSLNIEPALLHAHNLHLAEKFAQMEANETRVEVSDTEGAEMILVSYGSMSRIVGKAAELARKELGLSIGLVRPITVWPFPTAALAKAALQPSVKHVLAVEMSMGQLVDDVRLAAPGKPVSHYGKTGGVVPTVADVFAEIKRIKEGK